MKSKSFKKNLSFIIPIIVLLVTSLLNMYGAKFISPLYSKNLIRQAIWILLGIITMIFIIKIDNKALTKYSREFYILGIISLVLVLFFGHNVNGASSWFKIGAISFQPSEIFKFFYIIYLAKVIDSSKKRDLKLFIKVLLLTAIPVLLIFLEPDTGVVIMYALMFFGLVIESKIPKKYIVTLISAGSIFLVSFMLLYFLNGDLFLKIFGTSFFYRMDRLTSFSESSSYQLNNALIGVGASGPFGLGLHNPKIYIPEVTTDFVYDLTILNFGYIYGIFIILVFTYLLINIYKEKKKAKKLYDKLILSSIFYMMLYQVLEHILMNLGLFPITGITLPFISYGGSSMISYFMLFALIYKIKSRNLRD